MIKGKNILLILPADEDYLEFCSLFTRDNFTKLSNSEEEGYDFLVSNRDIISVVVIDIRLARKSGYEFVKKVCEDPLNASIPLIAVSPEPPVDEDLVCFEYGISDFITPPCPWELLSQRIFNAMRAKDSATFYEIEKMLEKLPCNIFLKDADGKYVFSTHYWDHFIRKNDPNWTIRGKTDLEVRKNKENAKKAHVSDMNIIATGKGQHYVIEEETDGEQQFFELIKEPVTDKNGTVIGIIAQVSNVTELENLRRKNNNNK